MVWPDGQVQVTVQAVIAELPAVTVTVLWKPPVQLLSMCQLAGAAVELHPKGGVATSSERAVVAQVLGGDRASARGQAGIPEVDHGLARWPGPGHCPGRDSGTARGHGDRDRGQ